MGLQKSLNAINKNYGEGTIYKLTDGNVSGVKMLGTGLPELDKILGGGLAVGRVIELYGAPGAGKTTLATLFMAEAQRQKQGVAFIDMEYAFDPQYAAKFGLDLSQVLFTQPSTAEEAIAITEELIDSGEVALVCIDSVAALTPQAELEGEAGQQHVGLQARLISHMMRKLVGKLANVGTTLLLINQIRHTIGGYGNPEVTSGGRAIRYYASQRLDVRMKGKLPNGIQSKITVAKNKIAPPFKDVLVDILWDGTTKEHKKRDD